MYTIPLNSLVHLLEHHMENKRIGLVIDSKRPPPHCSASNSSIWKLKLSPQPFTWLQVELLTLLTLHPLLHQSLEGSWLCCVFLKEGMNICVSSCLNGKRHLRDPTRLKTCCRQHGQISSLLQTCVPPSFVRGDDLEAALWYIIMVCSAVFLATMRHTLLCMCLSKYNSLRP